MIIMDDDDQHDLRKLKVIYRTIWYMLKEVKNNIHLKRA